MTNFLQDNLVPLQYLSCWKPGAYGTHRYFSELNLSLRNANCLNQLLENLLHIKKYLHSDLRGFGDSLGGSSGLLELQYYLPI